MKVCRWCGIRIRFWRSLCRDCKTRTEDAGIYLQAGAPSYPYMSRLPKAGQ